MRDRVTKERIALANGVALDEATVDTVESMVGATTSPPLQLSETALCEKLGIRSLRPFQRDVLCVFSKGIHRVSRLKDIDCYMKVGCEG